MRHAVRRPMGRLFYWLLTVVITAAGFGIPARGGVPQSSPATTIVAEVQLGELREGQNEIKAMIQAHDSASKKSGKK